MKKILYVYHASNIGGGSYAMLGVIKALDRNKYKPIVLLKKQGPLVDELRSMGVEVYLLPLINTVPYNRSLFTAHNIKRIVNIKRSFSKFAVLLKKIEPDVVYLNTMMLYPYLKIAKSNGFRTIIHIREHWPENEHVIQRNNAISNIRKYADHIVAINTFSASMVSDETHLPTIVYDWIDMDKRFKEMPYNEILGEDCSGKKVYLCTGGFDANKGTLQVAQAFSETIKETNCRLLILGTASPSVEKGSYAEQLKDVISNDSRIRLLPSTYNLTHIYQQAYCVLSYFTIPHANLALAESVILQIPAIAATNEEAIEYSHNGELAILFKANDYEDFKQCLRDFDNKREMLKQKLSEKAMYVAKLFNPQNNIDRLNNVYEQTIQ